MQTNSKHRPTGRKWEDNDQTGRVVQHKKRKSKVLKQASSIPLVPIIFSILSGAALCTVVLVCYLLVLVIVDFLEIEKCFKESNQRQEHKTNV